MLSLYVGNDQLEAVASAIAGEFRLDELVSVFDLLEHKPEASAYSLIVRKKGIFHPIDWTNSGPPYLMPEEIPFSTPHLLGLIFARLGNMQKAREYLAAHNPSLLLELGIWSRLRDGLPVSPEELVSEYGEFEEYRLMHNQAILRHYAPTEADFDAVKMRYFYEEALAAAPNDEYKAFSALHYATLFADLEELDRAENLLLAAIDYALSDEAGIELKNALAMVWLKKLTPPHDPELLERLKETLWEVLQAYEQQGRTAEVGVLLMDATKIATLSASYAEALGYISRAIDIFRRENLPELLANAQLRRGTLLYTWAQSGQPQFYRAALESYQEALKVYTREADPEIFAEIHHHLGVIYSEIPDEVKKKSIWAAVSSASFQEALQVYQLETHPYEYAMICNSFGNALTKFPEARHSDNYEKALYYYQEALQVRQAERFPLERAITLLNYLEACWYVQQDEDVLDVERYQDMVDKAREVQSLVEDPALLADAGRHLAKLEELKKAYAINP